jgi:tetratricopeptide (TPR) repeat protein
MEAVRYCEASLALCRQVGRPDRVAIVLKRLAWYQCCLGEYEKAIANWQENLDIFIQLGMQSEIAWTLDLLGYAAWSQDDLETARNYLQDALDLFRSLGMSSKVAMVLSEMALVLRAGGDVQQAVAVARQAVVIIRETGDHMRTVLSFAKLGAALIGAGDVAGAREALIEAGQRAWAGQYFAHLMVAFYYFAELLVLESSTSSLPNGLEEKALAVTLLTLVCTFRATWQTYGDKAAQLLAEIEGDLPAEMLAAAVSRGQSCSLEELINTLSISPLPTSS